MEKDVNGGEIFFEITLFFQDTSIDETPFWVMYVVPSGHSYYWGCLFSEGDVVTEEDVVTGGYVVPSGHAY